MFSTPLICCSIGLTTVAATTSALAPGYWPVTLMMGGAISGYCATGRRKNETPPMMTKTIETTAAKIGRSMKKCEMRSGAVSVALGAGSGRGRRSALLLRRHLGAGPHAHEALDDDAIVLVQIFLDHAQPVDRLAERHVARARDVLAVDHHQELACLLRADGAVGHQQRVVRRRARHPDAAEHAGREQPVGIGEHRAAANRARRLADRVVDEVHAAVVVERALVEKLEVERHRGPACRRILAAVHALVAQEGGFIEGELEADRVDRHDGGELRGVSADAAGNEIAGRDPAVAY